ncbi:GNAT family N-acetyltransferase [Streptomyces sp. NPDC001985]|uniref:GNAT family N-acetyltransferase n=1 Tax=Streptomyces sp. NPDC001985 TaxID=3154406 RepID=UPI003321881D
MPTPLPPLPMRRLTRSDLVSCANLSEDRGWPREEHKWGLLLSAGTGYGMDDPSGKGLAAACVVTSYGPGLSTIGMVLVAQQYARQGIGRRMMRQMLNEAGGTPLALHATAQGQPLYEELGFTAVGGAEMVRGRLRTDALAPGPGGRGRATTRPATADDLSAIVRLDTEVFGLDRTPVIARLPAFADQIRVAERDGVLTGYAAAWPNMDTHVIGPLIADSTETAQSLIVSLAPATDRPFRTDVDVRHRDLLGWLKENGLETVSSNTVMTHGISEVPGDWTRRFAPLSVALG